MPEGVEWGIHCCTVLALLPPGAAMPATRLAEFHGVPGAYLAKHLQALSAAGIVESVRGPRGGYRLARPASQTSLYDIVAAIDGDEPAFQCTEIRRRGPSACAAREYALPCGIARAMAAAEVAWRRELEGRTVADLVAGLAVDVSPRVAAKAAAWFQEVVR